MSFSYVINTPFYTIQFSSICIVTSNDILKMYSGLQQSMVIFTEEMPKHIIHYLTVLTPFHLAVSYTCHPSPVCNICGTTTPPCNTACWPPPRSLDRELGTSSSWSLWSSPLLSPSVIPKLSHSGCTWTLWTISASCLPAFPGTGTLGRCTHSLHLEQGTRINIYMNFTTL